MTKYFRWKPAPFVARIAVVVNDERHPWMAAKVNTVSVFAQDACWTPMTSPHHLADADLKLTRILVLP